MNEYILYLLPRGTYSQLGDKFNNVYYYIKAVYGRIFSGFLIQSHCPTNVPFFSGAHFRSALIRVPHCSHSCAVTFKCIFLQWISGLDPEKPLGSLPFGYMSLLSPPHLLPSFIL